MTTLTALLAVVAVGTAHAECRAGYTNEIGPSYARSTFERGDNDNFNAHDGTTTTISVGGEHCLNSGPRADFLLGWGVGTQTTTQTVEVATFRYDSIRDVDVQIGTEDLDVPTVSATNIGIGVKWRW